MAPDSTRPSRQCRSKSSQVVALGRTLILQCGCDAMHVPLFNSTCDCCWSNLTSGSPKWYRNDLWCLWIVRFCTLPPEKKLVRLSGVMSYGQLDMWTLIWSGGEASRGTEKYNQRVRVERERLSLCTVFGTIECFSRCKLPVPASITVHTSSVYAAFLNIFFGNTLWFSACHDNYYKWSVCPAFDGRLLRLAQATCTD